MTQTIYRKDYQKPNFKIISLSLEFYLNKDKTRVIAVSEWEFLESKKPLDKAETEYDSVDQNLDQYLTTQDSSPKSGFSQDLILNGEYQDLILLEAGGKKLIENNQSLFSEVVLDEHGVCIKADFVDSLLVGRKMTLKVVSDNNPRNNTRLSGLYLSGEKLFTQCEAEGFRSITYFPDRPDVMTVFEVTIIGSRSDFPVMLSNGNLIAEGEFDKFNLDKRESGEDKLVENKSGEKDSDQRAGQTKTLTGQLDTKKLKSDFEKYSDDNFWDFFGNKTGLHYSFWHDPFAKPCYLFALVAGDFVVREDSIVRASGKPALLQIYSSQKDLEKTEFAMQSLKKAILWDEQKFGLELDLDRFMIVVTSDFNFGAMENKGLNIFNARLVLVHPAYSLDKNFGDVEGVVAHEYFHNWTGNRVTCRDWFQLTLKEGLTVFRDQSFSSDQMPTPESKSIFRISDINNLETYQFAEDAGPLSHPIRPESYQKIDNFYTHTVYDKGAEVIRMIHTILGEEGFRKGMDLYFQRHDGQAVTCDDFTQAMKDTNPENPDFDLELFRDWYSMSGTPKLKITFEEDGTYLSFDENTRARPRLFPMNYRVGDKEYISVANFGKNYKQGDRILLSKEKGLVSFNRGFVAPVLVDMNYSEDDYLSLLESETDPISLFNIIQELYFRWITNRLSKVPKLIDKLSQIATNPKLDPGYKELLLRTPLASIIKEKIGHEVDPVWVYESIESVKRILTGSIDWYAIYAEHKQKAENYKYDRQQVSRRAFSNLALQYIFYTDFERAAEIARDQYEEGKKANIFHDRYMAFVTMLKNGLTEYIDPFYQEFQDNDLVLDMWYTSLAISPDTKVMKILEDLVESPDFRITNPNRVKSVVSGLISNYKLFYTQKGYQIWKDMILKLDKINPQTGAVVAKSLSSYNQFVPKIGSEIKAAYQEIGQKATSPEILEIVNLILKD